MGVSVFSLIVGLFFFTVMALLGSVMLPRATKGGVLLTGVIFVFALARIFIPINFKYTYYIHSEKIYPAIIYLLREELFWGITVGDALIFVWVCGFCFFAARLAGKLYAVHKFNRSSVPVAVGSRPDILAKELCASAEYKRKRPLDLRISSRAFGAYQSGLFSASIILPKNIDDFSDSEINFMLRHELCHFRSGDLIILLILRLLECVLWWNPTVFLLRKSVERMLELRCDRRVCESMTGSERADYMETLLKLARGSVSKEEQAVMRFQGRQGASELEQRITILTDTKKGPAASRGLLAFVMVGFVLLFTASYFVIVIPWGTPPPEDMEYVLDVNPETSYIVHTDSGEYILYYDGTVLEANLPEDILKMDPYRNLVIYEGEKPEP